MTDVADWWSTEIIKMAPGQIELRGRPIEQLIGEASFVEMVWRMTMGTQPSAGQLAILEAALVAAVDHGPQAPSIAAARMAATCGVGLNSALATGVNMLGDVHGGAGQQCLEMLDSLVQVGPSVETARALVLDYQRDVGKHLPGFGHRFHRPEDPRAQPLFVVAQANADDCVDLRYIEAVCLIQQALSADKERAIAINIDGATAALYGAIGVPSALARGLFCLSRSVGILAHAWEQTQQGGRNKGPTPPHYRWTYTGP